VSNRTATVALTPRGSPHAASPITEQAIAASLNVGVRIIRRDNELVGIFTS